MKKELKIIVECEENELIMTQRVKIFLDDKQIGLVKSIKFEANSDNDLAYVEAVFPYVEDLHGDFVIDMKNNMKELNKLGIKSSHAEKTND